MAKNEMATRYAAGQTMAASAAVSGLTLVVGIATARILGPTDRGLFTTVVVATSLASTLATLGSGEALVIHGKASGSTYDFRRAAWAFTVSISSVAAVGALLYLRPVAVDTIARVAIVIGATVMGATGTLGLSDRLGQGAISSSNLIRLSPAAAQTATFGTLWALNIPLSLDAALMFYVGSVSIPAMIALLLAWRDQSAGRTSSPSARTAIAIMAPLWAGRVAQVVATRVDVLTLAYLVPAAYVAQYNVAFSTVVAATSVSSSVGVLMLRDAKSTSIVGSAGSAAALLTALVAAALGPSLIPLLYGAEYALAGSLVPLMAGLAFAQLLFDYLLRALQRRADNRLAITLSAMQVVINTIVLILVVPPFGLQGAVLALALAYALSLGTAFAFTRRAADMSWDFASPRLAILTCCRLLSAAWHPPMRVAEESETVPDGANNHPDKK